MKFPIDVKIYYKEKYVSDGRFTEEHIFEYTGNLLSNFHELNGHYENEKETGFKYGCGHNWNTLYPNLSNKEWLKIITNKHMKGYIFIIKNNFEEIKL